MRIGQVIGNIVSTCKHERLIGAKLLLIQPITPEAKPSGNLVVAVDAVQAGVGDTVLLVLEGRAAISALGRAGAPVDAAVLGVVDQIDSSPVIAVR